MVRNGFRPSTVEQTCIASCFAASIPPTYCCQRSVGLSEGRFELQTVLAMRVKPFGTNLSLVRRHIEKNFSGKPQDMNQLTVW